MNIDGKENNRRKAFVAEARRAAQDKQLDNLTYAADDDAVIDAVMAESDYKNREARDVEAAAVAR